MLDAIIKPRGVEDIKGPIKLNNSDYKLEEYSLDESRSKEVIKQDKHNNKDGHDSQKYKPADKSVALLLMTGRRSNRHRGLKDLESINQHSDSHRPRATTFHCSGYL